MDTGSKEEEARLNALCTRLGRLWSPQHIDVWDEAPPETPPQGLLLLPPGPSDSRTQQVVIDPHKAQHLPFPTTSMQPTSLILVTGQTVLKSTSFSPEAPGLKCSNAVTEVTQSVTNSKKVKKKTSVANQDLSGQESQAVLSIWISSCSSRSF